MKIEKHYDALSISERFSLSLEAFARLDLIEIDRLQGTLPTLNYRTTDMRYWRRLQIFTTLALMHGVWRNQAFKRALMASTVLDVCEDPGTAEALAAGVSKSVSRLLAYDAAWDAFCESIGIDPKIGLQSVSLEMDGPIESMMLDAWTGIEGIDCDMDESFRDEVLELYRLRWHSIDKIN